MLLFSPFYVIAQNKHQKLCAVGKLPDLRWSDELCKHFCMSVIGISVLLMVYIKKKIENS